MHAHEVMSRHVITIDADASATHAIRAILFHHSGLPVVDAGGKLIGILSEGNFIRPVEVATEKRRGRWLPCRPARNGSRLVSSRDLAGRSARSCRPIPIAQHPPFSVMRGDEIVGIVTRTDLLAVIADFSLADVSYSYDDDRFHLSKITEEDYGGGDIISLQEEPSTANDEAS